MWARSRSTTWRDEQRREVAVRDGETHTHTQTEREREREGERVHEVKCMFVRESSIYSLCVYTLMSSVVHTETSSTESRRQTFSFDKYSITTTYKSCTAPQKHDLTTQARSSHLPLLHKSVVHCGHELLQHWIIKTTQLNLSPTAKPKNTKENLKYM